MSLYNIVLTSKTKHRDNWEGKNGTTFIGEVFSYWETYTDKDALDRRVGALADEHGVSPSEIEVHLM